MLDVKIVKPSRCLILCSCFPSTEIAPTRTSDKRKANGNTLRFPAKRTFIHFTTAVVRNVTNVSFFKLSCQTWKTYFDLQLFLRIRNIYIDSTAEEGQPEPEPQQPGKKQKTALAGPSGAKNPPTAPKSPKAKNNQPGNTRCCFLLSDYLCHRYSSHVQHDKPSRLVLYLLPS